MKKLMLIGREGCGKTTLIQAINEVEIKYRKTQAVEFYKTIIDTPGEYIENKGYYKALTVTSADCDIIALMQSCTDEECIFPPNFASVFSKPVIGIITKLDCEEGDEIRAFDCLMASGAKRIYSISSFTGLGVDSIKKLMEYMG